jgi:plastocyanin
MDKQQVQTPTVTPTKVFSEPEPTTVYVEIKGTMFNPPEWKVVNGTTVKWTNMDSASYVVNVDGVQSPLLNKRDSWKYTFNKTGIFEYKCSIHPAMPKGKIIVE